MRPKRQEAGSKQRWGLGEPGRPGALSDWSWGEKQVSERRVRPFSSRNRSARALDLGWLGTKGGQDFHATGEEGVARGLEGDLIKNGKCTDTKGSALRQEQLAPASCVRLSTRCYSANCVCVQLHLLELKKEKR